MRARLLAVLAALPGSLAAQGRSLVIQRFDAAIVVDTNATIDVTETIVPKFTGSWNGLYRTIPVDYHTPQGFNWTIRFSLLSVTDGQGNALRTDQSRERHYLKLKIWIPGAQDAVKTVVIHYRATNALRFFDEHDELYWNVTGDEWDVPIEAVSAQIRLPAKASGVRAIAFNGAYGSTAQDASVAIDGPSVQVTMPHALAFHEGMTAVVGWDKGLVRQPTALARAGDFAAANWPLFLPIPIFFGMFAIWRAKGRDPRQLPITVQYDPPDQLTPGEAGTLIDNSADMRDITATLVDLAVKGYLKIEETEDAKLFGLIKDRDFTFHRLKPESEWDALQEHEKRVLDGVFGGRSTVALSDLENEFYKSLTGIKNAIFDRLLDRRFYRARPDNVKARWMVGAVFLGGLLAVGGGGALAARLSMTPLPFVLAGIISASIVGGFGLVMPARTVRGARTLEQVLGFEEFLGRTEGDRLRNFVRTPDMFEKFLPFAMAFGVEKKWAKAFESMALEPPRWYAGAAGYQAFNAATFSTRLSAMATKASSTMASSPRSSGGSGFSGGSSGGGGGGGGGGGF